MHIYSDAFDGYARLMVMVVWEGAKAGRTRSQGLWAIVGARAGRTRSGGWGSSGRMRMRLAMITVFGEHNR